ncbi:MAG TPA: hydroxymethylbilane synthase [Polyangiaceae bacterium]|nr:hydroxymethylbilane synthase [Polyangiaceae bacterium]
MRRTITLATRKSALALAQSRAWGLELKQRWQLEIEELLITTTGDRIVDRALNEVGGKGLFIKEIEEALLDRRADIAVHSLKDVPAELAPSLTLGCIPKREDPRDVIVTRSGCSFEQLPAGSVVGTSSLRRKVQLQAARPELQFVPLRGNVDTRLRRCEEGAVDAIVLAYAGLRRLGLGHRVTQVLDPSVVLPSIGQGALAIECRADDQPTLDLLAPLQDQQTALCVSAERGVMQAVEGSCQVPVAAYAERTAEGMSLRGFLAEIDGSRVRQQQISTPWPTSERQAYELGQALGRKLKVA